MKPEVGEYDHTYDVPEREQQQDLSLATAFTKH
jgi:hypothetical protein